MPVHRHTLADLLRRSAAREPHKLAIACGDTRWSYEQFHAITERIAAGVGAQRIGKGDRVAILARNSHAFIALRFALARLGAVLVPINFMLKSEEVAYILRHAGARMLATDSALAPLAQAAVAQDTKVERVIWLPGEEPAAVPPGMLDFHELAASNGVVPEVALSGGDLAQIVYT